MFLTKRQPEKREKSFEEMSNLELFEVLLANPKEIPEERLVRYFKEELDIGNIEEAFEKSDFENQKYFIQKMPDKKLKYVLKNAVKFQKTSVLEIFMSFLANVMNEDDSGKREIFRRVGNLMENDEDMKCVLFEMFYQMEAEEFLEVYKNCLKIVKIEILERIFSDSSNTIGNRILQYNARFTLEKLGKLGEISLTEQLYLAYAYSNNE